MTITPRGRHPVRLRFPGMSPEGLGSEAPESPISPGARGLTFREKHDTLGGKPREGSSEYILKLVLVGPEGLETEVRLCCGKHLSSDLGMVVSMVVWPQKLWPNAPVVGETGDAEEQALWDHCSGGDGGQSDQS